MNNSLWNKQRKGLIILAMLSLAIMVLSTAADILSLEQQRFHVVQMLDAVRIDTPGGEHLFAEPPPKLSSLLLVSYVKVPHAQAPIVPICISARWKSQIKSETEFAEKYINCSEIVRKQICSSWPKNWQHPGQVDFEARFDSTGNFKGLSFDNYNAPPEFNAHMHRSIMFDKIRAVYNTCLIKPVKYDLPSGVAELSVGFTACVDAEILPRFKTYRTPLFRWRATDSD